jgi:hypothetical protein
MNLTWIRSWLLEPKPSQEQAHLELDPAEVQVVEEAPTGVRSKWLEEGWIAYLKLLQELLNHKLVRKVAKQKH